MNCPTCIDKLLLEPIYDSILKVIDIALKDNIIYLI